MNPLHRNGHPQNGQISRVVKFHVSLFWISERTIEAMNQLRTTNKKFTKSIFSWDVNEDGMLVPNWAEQDIIDYMAWQINEN